MSDRIEEETKYTSGPYTVLENAQLSDEPIYLIRSEKGVVAFIDGMFKSETKSANARLLAAAPEMAEALIMCHRVLLQTDNPDDYITRSVDEAYAALQKAGLL